MQDWLTKCLNERERMMYRIAMINAKDGREVDEAFYHMFGMEKEDTSNKNIHTDE